MKVTLERVRQEACSPDADEVKIFERLFGKGPVALTEKNIHRYVLAVNRKLDGRWAGQETVDNLLLDGVVFGADLAVTFSLSKAGLIKNGWGSVGPKLYAKEVAAFIRNWERRRR